MNNFDGADGWFPKLKDKEYFAAPEISFSDMSLALKGPLQWQNRKRYPHQESPALEFGKLFHEAMLYDKWPTKMPVAAKRHIEAMHSQLKKVELFRRVMEASSGAQIEVPGFHSGYKCKPDIRVPKWGLIIDLKSTSDATPWSFKWSAKKFNYHLQARHYLDVANDIDGEGKYQNFLFVATEKAPPYNIYIHECSSGVLARADELKQKAVDLISLYRQQDLVDRLAKAEQDQVYEINF